MILSSISLSMKKIQESAMLSREVIIGANGFPIGEGDIEAASMPIVDPSRAIQRLQQTSILPLISNFNEETGIHMKCRTTVRWQRTMAFLKITLNSIVVGQGVVLDPEASSNLMGSITCLNRQHLRCSRHSPNIWIDSLVLNYHL